MRFSNGKLYGLVPCQAYQDERLSRRQLRLLLALLCHADAEGRVGLRRAQFSRELGVPEAQISELTQELIRLGWLDRQDKGEHGKGWSYRVTVPDPAAIQTGTVTEMITVGDKTVTELATGTDSITVTAETTPLPAAADDAPRQEGSAESGPSAAAGENGFAGQDHPLSALASAAQDAPIVITIPLLGREGEFAVTEAMVAEWQDAFPGVDVRRTLKRIRLWCLDNPTRRKTRRGVRRFLTGWLARDQDRGLGNSDSASGGRPPDWFKGAL